MKLGMQRLQARKRRSFLIWSTVVSSFCAVPHPFPAPTWLLMAFMLAQSPPRRFRLHDGCCPRGTCYPPQETALTLASSSSSFRLRASSQPLRSKRCPTSRPPSLYGKAVLLITAFLIWKSFSLDHRRLERCPMLIGADQDTDHETVHNTDH